MAYKLIISERADELIDNLTGYLLYRLNNTEAAIHFLNELQSIYIRLVYNMISSLPQAGKKMGASPP